jgi:hypothetical protein
MNLVPLNSYAAQGLTLPPVRLEDGERVEVPAASQSNLRLMDEPHNVSHGARANTLQVALRQAEFGNTRHLFAFYRDSILTGSHLQAELAKRKLAVIGDPLAILPADKSNRDDVIAAHACSHLVNTCLGWGNAMVHLLDSVFYPVAVVEKIFKPGGHFNIGNGRSLPLSFDLAELRPLNHTLLCFEESAGVTVDFNAWEPHLRFYAVSATGEASWSAAESLPADPMRHIIHRGHLMTGQRDNFGGPGRACLPWWLLSILARDWFARAMERYGSPFPVAKTDTSNAAAVAFLQNALSLSTKIGGLVVDENTQVELVQAMQVNMADGYERFLAVCNREISKVILGQTLSSEAQPTGLGSGTSNLHGDVRNDICKFDRQQLAETIYDQLFKPFLQINGLKGTPPTIVWGGLSMEKAASLGALLVQLSQAGLEPADQSLDLIGEQVGFQLQRKAAAPASYALNALNASGLPPGAGDPFSDDVARSKSAALARAFRGDLAPVRDIILNSASPEEALRGMTRHFSTWRPAKIAAVLEEGLQICAAAGARQLPAPSMDGSVVSLGPAGAVGKAGR